MSPLCRGVPGNSDHRTRALGRSLTPSSDGTLAQPLCGMRDLDAKWLCSFLQREEEAASNVSRSVGASAKSEQKHLDGRCPSDKREWAAGCTGTLEVERLGPSPFFPWLSYVLWGKMAVLGPSVSSSVKWR